MNENLNLMEILKDCPKRKKLYSSLFGDVYFLRINLGGLICVEIATGDVRYFYPDGKYYSKYRESECLLFPSRENRDWATFNKPTEKFSPNDLKPFDRILCRNSEEEEWFCSLFSHLEKDVVEDKVFIISSGGCHDRVIPFNEETAHLVGTTEDCRDYYKWWED